MGKGRPNRWRLIAALLCASALPLAASDFRAGVARIDITPRHPVWMAGYDDRTHASDGVVHRLWAKALAIADSKGNRCVIVATDIIGLPRVITDLVSARAAKQYGLSRSCLLFNASHSHTAPLLVPRSRPRYNLDDAQLEALDDYSRKLSQDLLDAIGGAMGALSDAEISYGLGQAHFAVNRREKTPPGVIIGVDPNGPVDNDVPVLRVTTPDGRLLAVLFGYACHNTTLTEKFYKISGDYAGFAAIDIERAHPGTTAMFLQLCAGDQNPNPRGTLEMAREHGGTLAAEVERVLKTSLSPVKPPIRATFTNITLAFALHTRETFEKELRSSDPGEVRRARAMLRTYDDRHPIHDLQYPIQAIRFGNTLTILALGGEPVVGYGLRAKREYPGHLIVAGYSNDVAAYIATQSMLPEGGYEVVDSMVGYGQPGPWADDVEDRVFEGIHRVMKTVGLSAK